MFKHQNHITTTMTIPCPFCNKPMSCEEDDAMEPCISCLISAYDEQIFMEALTNPEIDDVTAFVMTDGRVNRLNELEANSVLRWMQTASASIAPPDDCPF